MPYQKETSIAKCSEIREEYIVNAGAIDLAGTEGDAPFLDRQTHRAESLKNLDAPNEAHVERDINRRALRVNMCIETVNYV